MALTDEEIQAIASEARAAVAETKQTKEQLAATQRENQQLRNAYQQDMQIIGNWMNQQRQQATAQPETDDEPTELTLDKVRQIVSQELQQPATRFSGALLEQQRQVAALTIPLYNEYRAEVDEVVRQAIAADPSAATNPTLYSAAVDVVRLRHHDDIVQKEVERRLQASANPDDADGDYLEDEAAATSTTQSSSASPRVPPLVAPSGVGVRRTAQRTPKITLTEEEAKWAARAGLTAQQFVDEYADPKYSPDVLGFNDKDGKRRASV